VDRLELQPMSGLSKEMVTHAQQALVNMENTFSSIQHTKNTKISVNILLYHEINRPWHHATAYIAQTEANGAPVGETLSAPDSTSTTLSIIYVKILFHELNWPRHHAMAYIPQTGANGAHGKYSQLQTQTLKIIYVNNMCSMK